MIDKWIWGYPISGEPIYLWGDVCPHFGTVARFIARCHPRMNLKDVQVGRLSEDFSIVGCNASSDEYDLTCDMPMPCQDLSCDFNPSQKHQSWAPKRNLKLCQPETLKSA